MSRFCIGPSIRVFHWQKYFEIRDFFKVSKISSNLVIYENLDEKLFKIEIPDIWNFFPIPVRALYYEPQSKISIF